jgi:large subunit ribosomal protein L22
MEARASSKYLRGSAQKARLVVDMIRGKNVNEALAVLQYTNKRAASGIEKCVRSAIANATEAAEKANVAVDPDDLWVKACFVDMGPHKNRRRVRPAPQGRAYREQRHFCHVTVLLSNDDRAGTATKSDGRKQTSKAGKPATSDKAKASKKTAGAKASSVEDKSASKAAASKRASKKTGEPVKKKESPADKSAAVETAGADESAE